MRDLAHATPPLGMRPLSLASYATLQAVGSRYLDATATPAAIDAVVWWHVHTAKIHDAGALSQVAPSHAEIIALAACEAAGIQAIELDAIDAWARQSIAVLAASRAEARETGGEPSKN